MNVRDLSARRDPSRGAAEACSPGRKPWVPGANPASPERAKERDAALKVSPQAGVGAAGVGAAIRAAIQKIPRGKVSTYGAIARAAGLPHGARQVARALHKSFGLPWQRVLGAGGEIKLRGDSAIEQRLRLEAEGVRFRGRRVDMKAHEFKF